jgi:hypothetical protein
MVFALASQYPFQADGALVHIHLKYEYKQIYHIIILIKNFYMIYVDLDNCLVTFFFFLISSVRLYK